MRNWKHYEGLLKNDSVEIKIFNNFGDIESRCQINNMLYNINKYNTEIEPKKLL